MRCIHDHRDLRVVDYICVATPDDAPFEEAHDAYSLSFVRRGSFGCVKGGRRYELTAGGFFVGAPDDVYVCTHDHHDGGDECLSFQFSAARAEEFGGRRELWRCVALPPVADLAPYGALGQAAADAAVDVSLEEAGLMLGARFVDTALGAPRAQVKPAPRETRRALEAAAWILEHSAERVQLADAAAHADLSVFHFLRVFRRTIGATPNQYLVACRLGAAAETLSRTDQSVTGIAYASGFDDLSHFQRTFKRAAGMTPGQFRRLARGDRKILQEHLLNRRYA